jgi:hypothetical protein
MYLEIKEMGVRDGLREDLKLVGGVEKGLRWMNWKRCYDCEWYAVVMGMMMRGYFEIEILGGSKIRSGRYWSLDVNHLKRNLWKKMKLKRLDDGMVVEDANRLNDENREIDDYYYYLSDGDKGENHCTEGKVNNNRFAVDWTIAVAAVERVTFAGKPNELDVGYWDQSRYKGWAVDDEDNKKDEKVE